MNAESRRLKIAFLTSGDARDRRFWSGTPFYMARALQKHCGEVIHLGPVKPGRKKIVKFYNKLSKTFLRKNYDYNDSVFLSKGYAKIFEQKLSEKAFDLIFAPAARAEIAFLESRIPIVYAADTTFRLIHNYYPGFSNLLDRSAREGNWVEEAAIQKAYLLLYSSEWAAASACNDYHADPAKTHVVPFGANLDELPTGEAAQNRKKSDRCRLLFLGTNWKGKGGELTFETLLKLEEMGIPAELLVCGCTPPERYAKRITQLPFLDKNDPVQQRKLAELFFASDFLFLPTRFDCTPIAFCEAAAFGLPVVTADTGGVSGVVKNGENGFLFLPNAGAAEYAGLIAELYRDDRRYGELVKSSRKAFDERLNWDAWGKTVAKLLADLV